MIWSAEYLVIKSNLNTYIDVFLINTDSFNLWNKQKNVHKHN